jgi:hypothetical protein
VYAGILCPVAHEQAWRPLIYAYEEQQAKAFTESKGMGVIIIFFLQEKNIWANNDKIGKSGLHQQLLSA